MRPSKKEDTFYSKIISERIASYNRRHLKEAFQSTDESEFTMDYGPNTFSEEAMLNVSDREHLSDEEWEEIRSRNLGTINSCIESISDFWWKQFVGNFNDFLYHHNKEHNEELTFDELILDEWHGLEETVSLNYPEDESYYTQMCKALQESATEAEEATYKQFSNWLTDISKAHNI